MIDHDTLLDEITRLANVERSIKAQLQDAAIAPTSLASSGPTSAKLPGSRNRSPTQDGATRVEQPPRIINDVFAVMLEANYHLKMKH